MSDQPTEEDLARQAALAEAIMREDRDVLRALAGVSREPPSNPPAEPPAPTVSHGPER